MGCSDLTLPVFRHFVTEGEGGVCNGYLVVITRSKEETNL